MASSRWVSLVVLSLVLQFAVEIKGQSLAESRQLPDLLPPWVRRYFFASQPTQVTNSSEALTIFPPISLNAE